MSGNTDEIQLEKQWHKKFPSTLSGLFAFYQCLCTIAIIGCELGSILIDLFNSTIYVGFWASIFLIIAWISQALAVSGHRTRRCATYALLFQCISLFFAVCIIGFDAYFLIRPTGCFFPVSLCNNTASTRGIFYSTNNVNSIKIPLIKGQLAIAAVMFAFHLTYLIMYIVTRSRVKNGRKSTLKSSNKCVLPSIDNITKNILSTKSPDDVLITDENVIKSSSTTTTDIDVSTKTINTALTETTDTNTLVKDESVVKSFLSTAIHVNVSTGNDNAETSVLTKTTNINISVTDETVIKSLSPPSADINMMVSTNGTLNTSLVESLYRSRWSMDSDDLVPVKI